MDIKLRDEIWHEARQTIAYDGFYGRASLSQPRFSPSSIHYSIAYARQHAAGRSLFLLTDTDLSGLALDIPVIHDPDNVTMASSLFLLAFHADDRMLAMARKILANGGKIMGLRSPYWSFPPARYFHQNGLAREVLEKEAESDLLHFDSADFENIFQALELTRDVPGDYVEIGVYKGARAKAALHYMALSRIHRPTWLLDTFEGMSGEFTEQSAEAGWDGRFPDYSLEEVQQRLMEYPQAKLVRANIVHEPLPDEIERIAVAHIDVDILEATSAALSKVHAKMSPGGIIIMDDQGHTPMLCGAYIALRDFLDGPEGGSYRTIHFPTGQAFLLRR
ncbi:MAG: TylF/MycF/NovP-related O-methyltransferase [Sulfuricellaceae bacterium]